MAASSSCCILLVYGIPGSGKTILTDYLCAQALGYSMLPIHFDSFYPPDNRIQIELENPESDGVTFEMKQERQQVYECIDRFVQVNILGHSAERSEEDSRTPQLWDTFISYLQKYRHIFHITHPDGKFSLPSPSVLVLDDNLPLRSMRYQFFQMAKKYKLGFGELCICCEVAVAQARNAKRQNPIPNSTISSMERRLELSEPFKHHWERRSSIVHNTTTKEEFLRHTLDIARELISEALANPEQPTTLEEGRMKEASRIENLESYLHQADIIFRKCVSTSIKDYKGCERSAFAHQVNSIRKELLEEARTGDLFEQCQVSTVSATSSEFETTLQQLFRVKLESQLHV